MDSGILFICTLENIAEGGRMPRQVLRKIKRYWFEARTVGVNRQYLAFGVNQRVDLLVRIHYDSKINVGMYVITGDGNQYRIDNATMVRNDDGIRVTELSLYRLEENYELLEADR